MERSASGEVVGSSTMCQGKESCPSVYQVIAWQTSVPAVKPEVVFEPVPAPFGSGLEHLENTDLSSLLQRDKGDFVGVQIF